MIHSSLRKTSSPRSSTTPGPHAICHMTTKKVSENCRRRSRGNTVATVTNTAACVPVVPKSVVRHTDNVERQGARTHAHANGVRHPSPHGERIAQRTIKKQTQRLAHVHPILPLTTFAQDNVLHPWRAHHHAARLGRWHKALVFQTARVIRASYVRGRDQPAGSLCAIG